MREQFQERLAAGVAYDPKTRPAAVENLESWTRLGPELSYAPKKKHIEGSLRKCVGVQRLWLTGATEALLAEAAELPKLEQLFVERPVAVSFESLNRSLTLRRLGIFQSRKVLTLDSLASLVQLRVLSLRDLSRVRDLAPLSTLTALHSLAIDGPIENRWRVETLAPLASLHELKSLFMASVEVSDGLLAPLAKLRSLRILFCARYFPLEQFLELKRELPQLECPWFEEIGKSGSLESNVSASAAAGKDRLH